MRCQVQHFEVLNELLVGREAYPSIISYSGAELVLPYYEHGSLDDLSLGPDRPLVRDLTRESLSLLFEIAALVPPVPQARRAALGEVPAQARKRVARLETALSTPIGRDWGAQPTDSGVTTAEVVDRATNWAHDDVLMPLAKTIGPERLGLAAHGDFGLNNVLLVDPPSTNARLVFIDVRGHWYDGFPWWDPILDLATLIAFHCRIEPALAAAGEFAAEATKASGRLRENEIRELVRDAPSFQDWIADDPGWERRLEFAIAIRLLGNVSVQLLTAPRNPIRRASIVLELLRDQAERLEV
jgi:hypothetical protein